MEKSDHKRPSGNPSRVRGVEGSENVFGAVATVLRNGKHAHNNGDYTGKGPENGKGLRLVSDISPASLERRSHIEPWEPLVRGNTNNVA